MWAKVKKLERQVEAGDGSLFDLRRELRVETIVDTIAGNVPLGRIPKPPRAMTEKLAELKGCATKPRWRRRDVTMTASICIPSLILGIHNEP